MLKSYPQKTFVIFKFATYLPVLDEHVEKVSATKVTLYKIETLDV